MSKILPALAVAGALASPAVAQPVSFYLSADAPADLGGATFRSHQIVRYDSATSTYGLVLSLPESPPVDALHRMDGGDWLFSVETPTTLGGTDYEARDVIRFDGSTYALFLDGDAIGIPASSSVDALFLDGGDTGDLVLSVDVPTTLSGTDYEPGDLARWTGSAFAIVLDASAAGLPITGNVTGADRRHGQTILTVDVPTDAGGSLFLPGQLFSWNGASFASFFFDGSWPLSARVDGFTFLASPGVVPVTLTASKISASVLQLDWELSCSSGAEDYGIYEGELGSFTSHVAVDCTDDGSDTVEDVTTSSGSRYYLVVPHNGTNDEGSYGTDSSGTERPPGGSPCVATQALAPCP